MINAHISAAVATPGAKAPTMRPAMPLFWMQFACIVLVLGVTIGLVLNETPPAVSLSHVSQVQQVRDAVLADSSSRDPLIQLAPGVMVRSSNVRGLQLDGTVYYYYFEGDESYDPLSRGAVSARDVEVLLRDTSGATPLVIYQVQKSR